MARTRLSTAATPGRNYSFAPKTAAGSTHDGEFTHLNVTATPGRRHAFTAKDPAVPVGKTGEFTTLSPTAVPGKRYTFVAKTAAVIGAIDLGGGSSEPAPQQKMFRHVQRDDDEILMIITAFLEEV